MEYSDLLLIVLDPVKRTRRYREAVEAHYLLVTDAYRAIWGSSYHLAISGQPTESLPDAIRSTERALAEDGGFAPGMRVLDIGCGIGGPALTIAGCTGSEIVGFDLVHRHVVTAKHRAAEHGLSQRVRFCQADAMQLPFPSEAFDAVYLFESGCHTPDKQQLYRECARVLRLGRPFLGLDWFRRDRIIADGERAMIEAICRSFAMPSLIELTELREYLMAAGFHVHALNDVTGSWKPLRPDAVPLAPVDDAAQRMAEGARALTRAAHAGVFVLGYWRATKAST